MNQTVHTADKASKSKEANGRSRKGSLWRRCVKCRELYIFLLPAVLLVVIFNYFPMYGVVMAFQDFKPALGIGGSPFVGLEQFQRFFALPNFWPLIQNTLLLSLLTLVINMPLPILLAILINQIGKEKVKRFAQTVTYMPHFVSVVVVVGMMNILLSPSGGIYGAAMNILGLEPVNLLAKPGLFRWLYVLSDAWQHTGWNSIIYIAALSSVDPTLYEAAKVDGANRMQRIFHIDLPALVPTFVILLILNTGTIMSGGAFEKVFIMQKDPVLSVAEVLSTYVYKIGMTHAQFSFSTAINLFNTLINFIVLSIVNMISKKTTESSLW